MIAIITVLLAGLASTRNEDDVDKLLSALRDDTVAIREQAESDLRKLGIKALPRLEQAAKSNDTDFALRAGRLIRVIKDDAAVRDTLGPVRKVTLRVSHEPFLGILAQIDRLTEFTTPIKGSVENRKLTLEIDNVPYLEALDLLCRAHGSVRVEPMPGLGVTGSPRTGTRGWVEIRPGKPLAKPTVYPGPYRIRIEGVRLRRPQGTSVRFSIAWQPNVHPSSGPYVLVEKALDETGHDTVDEKERLENARLLGWKPGGRRWIESYRSWMKFRRLPDADASTWSEISGMALLGVALERPIMTWAPGQQGVKRGVGDYTVELSRFVTRETSASIKLICRRRDKRPIGSDEILPLDSSGIELLDAKGRAFRWTSGGGSRGQDESIRTFERSFRLDEGRVPARLRLRTILRATVTEVPFHFQDVPLPTWSTD